GAEAVEMLTASPDRVRPPCPHARPGGCGGCDWQHASLPAQRRLKAAVIRQQLARIGGIDREVTVEPLPGDAPGDGPGDAPGDAPAAAPGDAPSDPPGDAPGDAPGAAGLGWRTRVSFAVGPDGRAGLRKHRSHDIVDVGECPIAHPEVNAAGATRLRWPGARSVQVAAVPATGERGVLVTGPLRGRPPAIDASSVGLAG